MIQLIPTLRRLSILGSILALACLPSCGTPGSSGSSTTASAGTPTQVRYFGYVNGLKLALVNESHTSRTELYSEKRKLSEAGTKVTTDDVMSAVIEYFTEQSLFESAAPGRAPQASTNGATQALEIDIGGRVRHVLVGRNSSAAERQHFQTCATAFTQLYSETYGLQSVDEVPDFEAAATSKKKSAVKEP